MLGSAFYPEMLRSQWVAVSLRLLLFRVIAAQAAKECIESILSVLVIPSCCHCPLRPPAADVVGKGLLQPHQEQWNCKTGSRQLCFVLQMQKKTCAIWIRRPCLPFHSIVKSQNHTMTSSKYWMYSAWHFISASAKLTVSGLAVLFTALRTDLP